MSDRVFLSIGANLGDRAKNISDALEMLSEKCTIVAQSKIYATKPVGFTDQPDFLNIAVEIKTALLPSGLLEFTKSIESRLGRVRLFRWGPRQIDLDILFFGENVVKTPKLIIPHERAHLRRFVLVPMCEIAPDFMHPVLKKSMAQLLIKLPANGADKVEPYGGE